MPDEIKKYSQYPTGLVAVLIAADIFLAVVSSVNVAGIIIGTAALIAASALFACLIIMTRSVYIFLMCVPGFVISLILGGNAVYAFSGLAYIPLGFIVSFGIRQRLSRTRIIVRLSAAIAVLYVAAFVVAFISSSGSFSPRSVRDIINEQAEGVIDYYNLLLTPQESADAAPAISDENKQDFISSLKALVPSFFVIYCNFVSFFITYAFKPLYNALIVSPSSKIGKKRTKLQKENWKITISFVSTVIYVICVFFTMFFSSTDTVWVVIVMTNIFYILTPGLFIIGFYFAYGKIKLLCQNNYTSLVLIVIFMGIAFILFNSFVVIAISFCGVYSIQIGRIKKLTEKIKSSFYDSGDGGGNDNDLN